MPAVEINKFKSQLFVASEQAHNTLVELEKDLADKFRKLQEQLRTKASDLRKSLASFADVVNGKIGELKSQLFSGPDPVMAALRHVQNTITGMGRSLAEHIGKLREVLRAIGSDVQKLRENFIDAVGVVSGKIGKLKSQLFVLLAKLKVALRYTQNTITGLGKSVAEKPRRLQKTLRSRENDLRKLLASSLDAIVVTDAGRRLVTANQKALDLLGISEANVKKFNIDAFLSFGQVPYFDGTGSLFPGREKRHGECKIRRLDGSLRAAEYVFIPNFVPFRHLCRFHNVKSAQRNAVQNRSTRLVN